MNPKVLELQANLQAMTYGYDLESMTDEETRKYVFWNAWALADELHEAMAEMSWKPWAETQFINRDAFLKELIDLSHFLNNMWLAISGLPPVEAAELFEKLYEEKHIINARRQEEGYDGVTGKCPKCRRDIETTMWVHTDGDGRRLKYCLCGQFIEEVEEDD